MHIWGYSNIFLFTYLKYFEYALKISKQILCQQIFVPANGLGISLQRCLFFSQKVAGWACLPGNNTDYWEQKQRTNLRLSKTKLKNRFCFWCTYGKGSRLHKLNCLWYLTSSFSILALFSGPLLTFLALFAQLCHLAM